MKGGCHINCPFGFIGREKPLEGILPGYSMAANWSTRLIDRFGQVPEKVLLRPFYRRITMDRPIFVVGPFRSGTTILEKIISEHSSVGYFWYLSNVYIQSPVVGYWTTRLMQRLGLISSDTLPTLHNPRIPQSALSPYECEWIFSQSKKNLWDEKCIDLTEGSDFSDPHFERYLVSMIQRHLWVHRANRFLNKNPVHCLRMGYLFRLFPDARFVTIVRHPVHTILSHYRTAAKEERIMYADAKLKNIFHDALHVDMLPLRIQTRNYAKTLALNQEHPLLGIASQWKDMQLEVMESIANVPGLSAQVLQLRYEDLVLHSKWILEKLWRFVGLTGEEAEAITRAHAPRLTQPAPVKLSAEEQEYLPRVQEITATVASRLGYSIRD